MSEQTVTNGDDDVPVVPDPAAAPDPEVLLAALLDDIRDHAALLDGLMRVFRATVGERAQVRAEVFEQARDAALAVLNRHRGRTHP